MKFVVLVVCIITSLQLHAQDSLISTIEAYQAAENKKFATAETTVLTEEDFAIFDELQFYPINLKFRVNAQFVRTPNEEPFLMPTTTERLPEYVKYGEAHFLIDEKELQLNLYQSTTPYDEPGYEDYLFLPFTDLTSGDGSYGGGRFLDARIPKGDTIVLDFNKAYNPYCAYNKVYSCPIPPKENDLLIRIEAGVKDFGDH
ncbi:DUF1684 domain-containing protein [Cochleicola gelatinilyticus]|uniref:DUF1684 domain-containing protein n=1 Tax=Cochleicola gelatinilyticus TaxID=1763537 RepID=A0A167ER92_9FLAO|nr:DUF1684 domain-containing protein [Cochleicola gelatinilyticus]OAB75797.1 hypothetical protein ULVI_15080 [Cochleicola gelatinilyticus]